MSHLGRLVTSKLTRLHGRFKYTTSSTPAPTLNMNTHEILLVFVKMDEQTMTLEDSDKVLTFQHKHVVVNVLVYKWTF